MFPYSPDARLSYTGIIWLCKFIETFQIDKINPTIFFNNLKNFLK